MPPDSPHLSASQVDTYLLCPRKWAWNKRDGIKAPPHPSAELGTEVHRILAEWLSKGTAIDLDAEYETADGKTHYPGRIAAAGLKHLPAPGTHLEVEQRIDLHAGFASFVGYVDLAYGNIVLDHKTTSNFKWAKTAEDLRTNVQALIYAAHRMHTFKLEEVWLVWVYYRTRGKPASKKVQLKLTREEAEQGFKEIEWASKAMLKIHKKGQMALELEANPRACDMYGGCSYRDLCNLTPIERIKATMAKQTLAEKMAARKAAAAATETTTETAPVNPPGEAGEKAASPPAPPPEEKPAKTKRGRPKKEKAAPTPGDNLGFTLYVNCHPTKGVHIVASAASIVRPAAMAVAEQNGVLDYRMVEFGQGPAMLSAALRTGLMAVPSIAGLSVTLDARTDEGRHTLEVFSELAANVVRGF